MSTPPLIAHVLYRLDVGGLENGVVNLINGLPRGRYRHAIVSLTEATEFRERIQHPEVPVLTLHKREGKDLDLYRRLYRAFRQLRPQVVHTRNLATLEAQLPAWLAGVPCRIHGEHGWDMLDPDGASRRYQRLRRAFRPLVHEYIALSRHIRGYLEGPVAVPARRVNQIYNGVDSQRFHPGERAPVGPPGFAPPGTVVLGTVGRMQAVKDQLTLARAFVSLVKRRPDADALRLVMVGEGPLREQCRAILVEAGCGDRAWLPGSREDVPALMRGFDLFVLPSLAEGICNTILEAMATGLPVVATRVGGNPELVVEGRTGSLAPAGDPGGLAASVAGYLDRPELRAEHGRAGRARVEERFALARMLGDYAAVYDRLLRQHGFGGTVTEGTSGPALHDVTPS